MSTQKRSFRARKQKHLATLHAHIKACLIDMPLLPYILSFNAFRDMYTAGGCIGDNQPMNTPHLFLHTTPALRPLVEEVIEFSVGGVTWKGTHLSFVSPKQLQHLLYALGRLGLPLELDRASPDPC